MLMPSSGSWTSLRASRISSLVGTCASDDGALGLGVAGSIPSFRTSSGWALMAASSRDIVHTLSGFPGRDATPGRGRNASMAMRILIVDDHPVTRNGLRSALSMSDDIDVVGEASSGEEAVEVVADVKPDVVFMDVRMPGMGGIEATKIIRESAPRAKVILFTVDESRSSISEAIQAGVSGYLLKDVSADELINAARLALEGKAVIHPSLTRAFIEEVRLVDPPPQAPLSPRGAQILP